MYGIDRLDHIHLPDDLAHLIGLQVPDQVARNPLQMQKGLLGFIFLHAVFTDLPDSPGDGLIDPLRLYGLGHRQQRHRGTVASRLGAGGLYGILYPLQIISQLPVNE